METVTILWWTFLILALLVTLVDVYLLLRVIRLSREIKALSERTLPAAVGIYEHTRAGEALGQTAALSRSLAAKSGLLGPLVHALERKLTGKGA